MSTVHNVHIHYVPYTQNYLMKWNTNLFYPFFEENIMTSNLILSRCSYTLNAIYNAVKIIQLKYVEY